VAERESGESNPMSDKLETTEASSIPQTTKKTKPKWAIIVLSILKFLRIPFLCMLALAVGLYVGYAKIGKQPASEMLHMNTWKHLYDLVFTR
jgi:hypothetical protein